MFWRARMCRDDCHFAHSSSELRAKPDFRKTVLCTAWQSGECIAERCRYAHGNEELRGTAGVYKTQLCNWFASGGTCTRGAHCRHAHGEDDLRRPEPVKVCTGKTVYAV